MAIRIDQVQMRLTIEGRQALNELSKLEVEQDQLKASTGELIKALKAATKEFGKESEQAVAAGKALDAHNAQVTANTAAIDKLRNSQGDQLRLSQSLKRELSEQTRLMSKLTFGTDEYVKASQRASAIQKELDFRKINASDGGGFLSSIKANFPAALAGGIAGGVVGVDTTAFAALGSAISNIIPTLKKVADETTDVQIALNLTQEEANALNRELSKLDTRTPTEQLRQMATVAGDLNVPTEQVVGFVETINQANLAFGRDFGGNAEDVATKLGKIKGLFNETSGLTYADAISKIGSAFKVLNDDGPATTKNIVDFVTRVGQLPVALRPSIQNTAAFAAVLEEAGLTSENAASGFNKLLTESVKNTPAFAKFLNLTKKQFADLINTDPNGFILKLAENLKGLSNTQVGNVLKGLGLNDAQATAVISTFSNKLEQVTTKQTLANKAFEDGNRLAQVAAEKENNLAGQLERLGKMINQVFNESGLREGFTDMVKGFIDGVKEARPFFEIIVGIGKSVKNLIVQFYNLINNITEIVLLGNGLGQVFKFVGFTIGFVALGIRGMNEFIITTIDLLNVLFNKAKEGLNLFGGQFQVDPNANFSAFYDRYKKQSEAFKKDTYSFFGKKDKAATVEKTKPTGDGGSPTPPPPTGDDDPFSKDSKAEADKLKADLEARAQLIADYARRRQLLAESEANREVLRLEQETEKTLAELQKRGLSAKEYADIRAVLEDELKEKIIAIRQKQYAETDKLAKEAAEKARKLANDTALAVNEADIYKAEKAYEADEQAFKDALDRKATLKELADRKEQAKTSLYAVLFRKNYDLFLQEQAEAFGKTEEEKHLIALKYDLLRQKLADENSKKLAGLSEEAKKKAIKDAEDEFKRKEELRAAYLQVTATAIGAAIDLFKIGYDREEAEANRSYDRRLKGLENTQKSGLISEDAYQAAKAQIEQNYTNETRAIKRKQAEADKLNAIFQAGIQGALAIIKAAPNVPLQIVAGITTGIQLAKIIATPIPEFAEGGNTPSVGTLAMVGEKGREYIIPNWMLQRPDVAAMVGSLETIRSRTNATASSNYITQSNYNTTSNTDPLLLATLTKLQQRLDEPIQGVWAWQTFKDGYDQILDIQKSAMVQK